jgi:hypothetical protein
MIRFVVYLRLSYYLGGHIELGDTYRRSVAFSVTYAGV